MSLLITAECINCGACLPECPNEAIFETRAAAEATGIRVTEGIGVGDAIYVISYDRCTECVGHFDEPQCVQVCPVACIPINPQHIETRETLFEKYQRLQTIIPVITAR